MRFLIFRLSSIGTSDWSGIATLSLRKIERPSYTIGTTTHVLPLPEYKVSMEFVYRHSGDKKQFTSTDIDILMALDELLLQLEQLLQEPVMAVPFSGTQKSMGL